MTEFKEIKIERFKRVWLSKEAHELLRHEKRRLKKEGKGKSMTEINNNLIIDNLK